jgi:integrase
VAKVLTDLAARNEAKGSTRREIPDGKIAGLYLVVQPSGAKSWAYRYRAAGLPRKFTIGPFPDVSLATARNLAQRVAGDVAQGGDPSTRKRVERAAAKAAAAQVDDLVETVVDDFVRLYARKKTRDWRETERLLKKDVVATWRGRRLTDIAKKHVVKLLDDIVDRGAPVGANRTFAQLRKMCSWAVSRGILTVSPCDGVEAPSPEIERDRVLTPDELSLVWRAAEAIPTPYRQIVHMLVLTGARRDEVAGIEWGELDLAGETWTLPVARSKNRREHVVPLSCAALDVLRPITPVAKSPYVFGGGKAAPANFAKAKQRLDVEVAKLNESEPIEHWTLHDIRRTVATELAGLKFAPHVVEAVLNHKSGTIKGVAAVYNRYSYAAEKRDALDTWARRLDQILKGATESNEANFADMRAR